MLHLNLPLTVPTPLSSRPWTTDKQPRIDVMYFSIRVGVDYVKFNFYEA